MQEKKNYALEGLRGIAAVVVFISHFRFAFLADLRFKIERFVAPKFPGVFKVYLLNIYDLLLDGHLAVFIFWIMSAYVVTIKLFTTDDETGKKYLRNAFTKRYFRLLIPVAGSILLAYVLLAGGQMTNLDLAKLNSPHNNHEWLGSFYTFNANFLLAVRSAVWDTFFNYNGYTTYNTNLWTMQPELFGSFFVFAVFGVFGKHARRYLVYTVLSACVFFMHAYWLLAFIAGFLMADIFNTHYRFKFEAPTLLMFCFLLILPFFRIIPFYYHLSDYSDMFYVIMAFMLVYFALRNKLANHFLSHKIFVWLGKISFSLYLIHLPIICSFSTWLYMQLSYSYARNVLITFVSTTAVVFASSYLFYLLIDKPSLKISGRIGKMILRDSKV